MDTSPKLRQRCITQQPFHPLRKADITSACRMLALLDAGWPLPGKPEEGCSTAGAVPAAGPKYSLKWQSAIPQSTDLGKQETSVSSEKHQAIEHQGGEKTEPPHQDQGKHHNCQVVFFHVPSVHGEPAPGCRAAHSCSHSCCHSSPPHHVTGPSVW